MQQADDDGLDLLVEQLGGRLLDFVLVERDGLVAEDVDPPAHAPHPLERDERLVVVVGDDVQLVRIGHAEPGLNPALEAEVVLEPAGDDAADALALALEQAIEHRRAGVDA
ncbi:MAG: hypothetical protein R2691_05125 [Solirubrobacterales bacterium]